METIFGLQTGVDLYSKVKWLSVAFEVIIWKAVPSLLSVNLFQWGVRTFMNKEMSTSLTVLRIQFMWIDVEIYFVGGVND